MPITPDQAVTVARRHGLSLFDAESLSRMATDLADAERIAATFGSADLMSGDPATRRQRLAESQAAKAAHLARLQAAMDTDGHLTPEQYEAARNPEGNTQ